MKHKINGENAIEKYLINVGIITIYYVDGSTINVEYTREREMAILNRMIMQAKKLICQIEHIKEERKKYFNLATSTFPMFKGRTKKREYEKLVRALELKLLYIYDLETYFEIKDKYEELFTSGDEYLHEFPPLTINTYDELCEDDTYFGIYSYVKNIMLDEEWKEDHKKYWSNEEWERYWGYEEKDEVPINSREVTSIPTYNTLDNYHYEHKPKVLSKVLVNPFKDLDN